MDKIDVLDGKYTFIINLEPDQTFEFKCLRYGGPWIENYNTVAGARAVFALCSEYLALQCAHLQLKADYDELKFRMDGLEK